MRIYQVYGGLPVIDVIITSIADAVKIAQVIEKEYAEFLSIWEVWPDVDVLDIARLSVPNGDKIYNALHSLELLNRPVNYNDFETILQEK